MLISNTTPTNFTIYAPSRKCNLTNLDSFENLIMQRGLLKTNFNHILSISQEFAIILIFSNMEPCIIMFQNICKYHHISTTIFEAQLEQKTKSICLISLMLR